MSFRFGFQALKICFGMLSKIRYKKLNTPGMWPWVTKKLLKWEKAKHILFHSKPIFHLFLKGIFLSLRLIRKLAMCCKGFQRNDVQISKSNGVMRKKSCFLVMIWTNDFFIMTVWPFLIGTSFHWKPLQRCFQNRSCFPCSYNQTKAAAHLQCEIWHFYLLLVWNHTSGWIYNPWSEI